MQHLAYVERDLDAITGPVGATVRVFLTGADPETSITGAVVDRVVMADRLEAIVLEVAGRRVAIRWDAIESVVLLENG